MEFPLGEKTAYESFYQKLDARKRKRGSDECDRKWQDPKYDSAFILNAMSDDEDDLEQRPGEARTFLTMEPEWRSLEVSDVTDAIKAISAHYVLLVVSTICSC